MKVFEINMKNPKISSSCSFYKDSQPSDKNSSDSSNFISKRMGNKTNYFPKEDPENAHKDYRDFSPIDEFPSTWKKGAPKVNASKLPSAFGNIFQKTVKNKDPIKNIENIVNIQEYKQATQLLSPLKLEEKPPRQPKDKASSQFSRKSRQKPKKGNPLEPLKSYMLNFYRISQDLDIDFQTKLPQFISKDSLINNKLRLDEMITISIKKTGNSVSSLKKMLHAPGLLLYALKEIPIRSPETRKNMKEWISLWQSKLQGKSPVFVKVLGTFWNSPEGNVSILMELMNAGSLNGLIESIGSLNENVIKKLALDLSSALIEIHHEGHCYEGCITPEQILLDREGNIKISLGLSNGRAAGQCPRLFLNNIVTNTKISLLESQANDVYNMGFTLLSSAIGGLELMGFCDDEIDKFEACFHENSCKSYCCLLHAEENLLISKKDHRMTILSLLEKRGFSQGFIGFLCNCLKFNWETRTTMQNIIGSPFLNSLSISTTSLKDLIKVGLFYEYIEGETSITRAGFLEKLVESLKVVLPNCEKWFLKEEYKPYIIHLIPFNEGNKVFHVLEKELGVSRGNVFEKIRTVFQGFGFLI